MLHCKRRKRPHSPTFLRHRHVLPEEFSSENTAISFPLFDVLKRRLASVCCLIRNSPRSWIYFTVPEIFCLINERNVRFDFFKEFFLFLFYLCYRKRNSSGSHTSSQFLSAILEMRAIPMRSKTSQRHYTPENIIRDLLPNCSILLATVLKCRARKF